MQNVLLSVSISYGFAVESCRSEGVWGGRKAPISRKAACPNGSTGIHNNCQPSLACFTLEPLFTGYAHLTGLGAVGRAYIAHILKLVHYPACTGIAEFELSLQV